MACPRRLLFGGRPACARALACAAAHVAHRPCARPCRALCEDFLQNNGTPGSTAPIAAAAQQDEEEEQQRELAATQARPGSTSPAHAAAVAASQQLFRQGCEAERPGPCQQLCMDGVERVGAGAGAGQPACADAQCENGGGCEQAGPRGNPGASSSLSSSPSRRGGIPQPPGSRAQVCCSATCSQVQRGGGAVLAQPPQHANLWQASLQQHQQQQAGTPLTPVGPWSGGTLSKQPSASGFPRSVSVDSDNPSLGFGMREALAHLRCACEAHARNAVAHCTSPGSAAGAHSPAAGCMWRGPHLLHLHPACACRMGGGGGSGGDAPHRGPQALADLFREDSSADVGALDVSEHLAAGEGSPGAPALPRVVEASASAEAEAGLGPSSGAAAQHQSTAASGHQRQEQERERPDEQRPTQLQPGQQRELLVAASPGRGPVSGLAGSRPGRHRSRHPGGSAKGKCRLM